MTVTHPALPNDLRRFVLTSIPSVPHLEALLLMRTDGTAWRAEELARRLYISDERATQILRDLAAQRFLAVQADQYVFQPADAAASDLVDKLVAMYGRHLVEIAQLLHSKLDVAARHFADAFRLRKD